LAKLDDSLRATNSPETLELLCRSDGVFLAGIPLLRVAVNGLEPRSSADIRALVAAAYGTKIGSVSLRPGLQVAAEALNKFDLGRAMVACLHMRLPALTADAAVRLEVTHDALVKAGFNPDEPRDSQGRWATGGGDEAPSQTQEHFPKPILVSNGPANDQPTNDNELRNDQLLNLPAKVISTIFLKDCENHAIKGPGYIDKVQDCVDSFERTNYLIEQSEKDGKIMDVVVWPDNAMTLVKFGYIFPLILGEPF
jgi:hypothetical protein